MFIYRLTWPLRCAVRRLCNVFFTYLIKAVALICRGWATLVATVSLCLVTAALLSKGRKKTNEETISVIVNVLNAFNLDVGRKVIDRRVRKCAYVVLFPYWLLVVTSPIVLLVGLATYMLL